MARVTRIAVQVETDIRLMIPHHAPSIDRVRISPGSAPSGNRAGDPLLGKAVTRV
jgi:hypothetical protein